MTTPQEFLEWLEGQDGYSVRRDVVATKFPDLSFNLVGVTCMLDDDGNTLVPKRDYRDSIIYGTPLD